MLGNHYSDHQSLFVLGCPGHTVTLICAKQVGHSVHRWWAGDTTSGTSGPIAHRWSSHQRKLHYADQLLAGTAPHNVVHNHGHNSLSISGEKLFTNKVVRRRDWKVWREAGWECRAGRMSGTQVVAGSGADPLLQPAALLTYHPTCSPPKALDNHLGMWVEGQHANRSPLILPYHHFMYTCITKAVRVCNFATAEYVEHIDHYQMLLTILSYTHRALHMYLN